MEALGAVSESETEDNSRLTSVLSVFSLPLPSTRKFLFKVYLNIDEQKLIKSILCTNPTLFSVVSKIDDEMHNSIQTWIFYRKLK